MLHPLDGENYEIQVTRKSIADMQMLTPRKAVLVKLKRNMTRSENICPTKIYTKTSKNACPRDVSD